MLAVALTAFTFVSCDKTGEDNKNSDKFYGFWALADENPIHIDYKTQTGSITIPKELIDTEEDMVLTDEQVMLMINQALESNMEMLNTLAIETIKSDIPEYNTEVLGYTKDIDDGKWYKEDESLFGNYKDNEFVLALDLEELAAFSSFGSPALTKIIRDVTPSGNSIINVSMAVKQANDDALTLSIDKTRIMGVLMQLMAMSEDQGEAVPEEIKTALMSIIAEITTINADINLARQTK